MPLPLAVSGRPSGRLALLAQLLLLLTLTFTSSAHGLFIKRPCCSVYAHAGASFGPKLPWSAPGVQGYLARGTVSAGEGGSPVCRLRESDERMIPPEELEKKNVVVLVDRSETVLFAQAVLACQSLGASAVVVRDTLAMTKGDGTSLVEMGPKNAPGILIPSIFIAYKAGLRLEAILDKALTTMSEGGEEDPRVLVDLYAADDVGLVLGELPGLILFFLCATGVFFFFLVFVGTLCHRLTSTASTSRRSSSREPIARFVRRCRKRASRRARRGCRRLGLLTGSLHGSAEVRDEENEEEEEEEEEEEAGDREAEMGRADLNDPFLRMSSARHGSSARVVPTSQQRIKGPDGADLLVYPVVWETTAGGGESSPSSASIRVEPLQPPPRGLGQQPTVSENHHRVAYLERDPRDANEPLAAQQEL